MRYEDLDTCADLEQHVSLVPIEQTTSTEPVAQTGSWTFSLGVTSVLACAALMSVLPLESIESTSEPAVVSKVAQAPPRLAGSQVRAATAARHLLVVVPEEAGGEEDPDHGF